MRERVSGALSELNAVKTAILGTAILLCLLSWPVLAEQSLLMPRASESLLLDATRVGQRLFVVGDYGHILYSDDAGESWIQAEVPTRKMLTAICFPTPARGWAVGHDGLVLATVDAGQRWNVQRDGLAAQKIINEENLQRAQQAFKDSQQALVEAETVEARSLAQEAVSEGEFDLEDAQAAVEEPLNAPPLLDVFFTDELHGMAVGAFNTLLRTRDGGVHWEDVSSALDNPDEYHLNAITGNDDGALWIAAEGGLLFRSAGIGKEWEVLNSPYRGSWFGIVLAPGTSTLLVFGLRGNIFRSEDGGGNWQRITIDTDRTLAGGVFVNNTYVLLVGAAGTLLVSDDAGLTFTRQPSGERLHLSAVTSIADSAIVVGQGGVSAIAPFGGTP